ncbi:unnamed protein product [Soboliphyme baturini]|uniref:U6 snRNA-associated Sm-like protein LSm4 n=1 Tax=Soboliphyme baturini TaxID=241478 RepID=A0A183IBM5_9BILA|nr:unnamed protein product [Soboliphyme baturini]
MNIHLRDVICTSRDGDRFWRMPEVYVRGSTIKYLRIPEELLDMVKEEVKETRRVQKEVSRMRRSKFVLYAIFQRLQCIDFSKMVSHSLSLFRSPVILIGHGDKHVRQGL